MEGVYIEYKCVGEAGSYIFINTPDIQAVDQGASYNVMGFYIGF